MTRDEEQSLRDEMMDDARLEAEENEYYEYYEKQMHDYDYFTEHAISSELAIELRQLHKLCTEYDHDFEDVIVDAL